MELKKEIERLLFDLKVLGWTRKDVEQEYAYSPNYITQALSKGGNDKLLYNLTRLIERIKSEQNAKPSAPGDVMNRERALIKVLFHRVVKLEAERLGMPEDKVIAEMERDTKIALADLEQS